MVLTASPVFGSSAFSPVCTAATRTAIKMTRTKPLKVGLRSRKGALVCLFTHGSTFCRFSELPFRMLHRLDRSVLLAIVRLGRRGKGNCSPPRHIRFAKQD